MYVCNHEMPKSARYYIDRAEIVIFNYLKTLPQQPVLSKRNHVCMHVML